jgi:hypothetical protein
MRIETDLDGQERPVLEFTPFPKIGRLEKDMIVTEKIDGTNAAVVVTENGYVFAQSRTRVITPGDDNYGFARWVADHTDELRDGLGEGVHFGEWWGKGIQRGYGLNEKRFSLFNTNRWTSDSNLSYDGISRRCIECSVCYVVPVLYEGQFDTDVVTTIYTGLRASGSWAAPGFMNPEGVVIFHTARGATFKLSDAKVGP